MSITRKQLIVGGVVIAAAVFALMGGQYSSLDLMQQNARKNELARKIDALRVEVDSLDAYKKALATSPRLQERIAREVWGMSREGEIVYKFR